mgnify:CR=1 FL=1|jgi:hypothetical protein
MNSVVASLARPTSPYHLQTLGCPQKIPLPHWRRKCAHNMEATAGVRCCNISCSDAPGCTRSACRDTEYGRDPSTHEAASAACASLGLRLCSEKELLSGRRCKTGCGLDNVHVWTRDPCSAKDCGNNSAMCSADRSPKPRSPVIVITRSSSLKSGRISASGLRVGPARAWNLMTAPQVEAVARAALRAENECSCVTQLVEPALCLQQGSFCSVQCNAPMPRISRLAAIPLVTPTDCIVYAALHSTAQMSALGHTSVLLGAGHQRSAWLRISGAMETDGVLHVIVFGGSMLAGGGCNDTRYGEGDARCAYPTRFARALEQLALAMGRSLHVRVSSLAVGGMTTAGSLVMLPTTLKSAIDGIGEVPALLISDHCETSGIRILTPEATQESHRMLLITWRAFTDVD